MKHVEPAAGFQATSANSPMGLMAPANIQSESQDVGLQTAATQLLKDPLQVKRLMERVYQLIQQDLQEQRERLGLYGSRR